MPEGQSFSERQRKVLDRMLDGFEGKLVQMGDADRMLPRYGVAHIDDLLKRNILVKDAAGGRSTSYLLAPMK